MDKSSPLASPVEGNITNTSVEEINASEGKDTMGCESETGDNEAEKKLATEASKDVSGTEGGVAVKCRGY